MTSGTLRVQVAGIGLLGPGLDGWQASRAVLLGDSPWQNGPIPTRALPMLPPAERRRCPARVRIALAAAQEALLSSGLAAPDVASVFASSDDDGQLSQATFTALAADPPHASPTRFQNSVHNAAAGYWHIATGSLRASTSISAYDWTFAAALVEAATQLCVDTTPVLTVVCDTPFPAPLATLRRLDAALGVALLLCKDDARGGLATLNIDIDRNRAVDVSLDSVPAPFRQTPSGRALPLLAAIATGGPAVVELDYLGDAVLRVSVE